MRNDAEALRRWISSRQAGQERERMERRGRPLSTERSVRTALALVALAGQRLGWPLPVDEVDRRELALARECWKTLKGRLSR